MSWISTALTAVVTPGVVAALVTVGANLWLLRPRADLLLIGGQQTVDDADRLLRANNGDWNWINHQYWRPGAFVRMTNHGDGSAQQ